MKPEELADSLEEVFAYDGLATDSPQAIWLADNYKAILSALRRIEKLEAALRIARSGINAAYAMAQAEYQNLDRNAERHDKTVQGAYAAISQALTGEA